MSEENIQPINAHRMGELLTAIKGSPRIDRLIMDKETFYKFKNMSVRDDFDSDSYSTFCSIEFTVVDSKDDADALARRLCSMGERVIVMWEFGKSS